MSVAEITRNVDRPLRARLTHAGVQVDRIREIHIAAVVLALTAVVLCVEIVSLRGARPEVIRQSLPDPWSGIIILCVVALSWIWTHKTGSRTLSLIACALLLGCGLSIIAGGCLSLLLRTG